MATRVLLVDDHQVLREGLRNLLEKDGNIKVVGEAADGATALRIARELQPDVIVMDIAMPDMDGIDATRRISQEVPAVRILALSTYPKKTFISEMLKAGASGYILKQNAFEVVEEAIHKVADGQKFLCSEAAGLLAEQYSQTGARSSSGGLTEREQEVLKLLAEGKPSKEIAVLVGVNVKTIDACRRRIMQKLDVGSLAELVKYAIREGMTSVE